jgi:hypothetical protein
MSHASQSEQIEHVNGIKLFYRMSGTGSGHWLIDEKPQEVIPAMIEFLN